jgi:hypothetical protein
MTPPPTRRALADVLSPDELRVYDLLCELDGRQDRVTVSIEELTRLVNARKKRRTRSGEALPR